MTLQEMVDGAKRGAVIDLPDTTVRLKSLTIGKALTLLGKPGTVLEIEESITIDFGSGAEPEPSSIAASKLQ